MKHNYCAHAGTGLGMAEDGNALNTMAQVKEHIMLSGGVMTSMAMSKGVFTQFVRYNPAGNAVITASEDFIAPSSLSEISDARHLLLRLVGQPQKRRRRLVVVQEQVRKATLRDALWLRQQHLDLVAYHCLGNHYLARHVATKYCCQLCCTHTVRVQPPECPTVSNPLLGSCVLTANRIIIVKWGSHALHNQHESNLTRC